MELLQKEFKKLKLIPRTEGYTTDYWVDYKDTRLGSIASYEYKTQGSTQSKVKPYWNVYDYTGLNGGIGCKIGGDFKTKKQALNCIKEKILKKLLK